MYVKAQGQGQGTSKCSKKHLIYNGVGG